MDIGELLDRGSVVERGNAATKRQALQVAADVAARQFGLTPAEVLDALLDREAEGSTGVGFGVALPHAALPGLQRMRAVFVRLETPVVFDAIDDQPVDLVLALFAPAGAGSEHLRALARASRLLRRRDIREQLRAARSADAISVILSQEAAAYTAA